jgi:hypothetical protein
LHTRAHTHARARARTHAHTRARARAHTHTHTHTHFTRAHTLHALAYHAGRFWHGFWQEEIEEKAKQAYGL